MEKHMETRGFTTREYNVVLTVVTGLHIGSGDAGIEIGGVDLPVVKDKMNMPYIPGSSLKGKMRSLLEMRTDAFDKKDGGPHALNVEKCAQECDICRAFGVSGVPKKSMTDPSERKEWNSKVREILRAIGPTRMMVRDLVLSKNAKKRIETYGLERKTEVLIDRATGTAKNHVGPRTMERIPPGTVFKGQIVFRVFDIGDGGVADQKIADKLCGRDNEGDKLESELKMFLEADCLGGHGSRGSGQVTIDFRLQKK
jgi:CRISPR-associated protein Csm3